MPNPIKIVFLDSHTLVAGGDISLESLDHFGQVEIYGSTDNNQIVERCKNADVIISNKVVLDAPTLDQLENLKYIVVAATGYNNIDIQKAKQLGIPVSNVVAYSSSSVAQQVFALLLAYLNRAQEYFEETRAGKWSKQEHFSYQNHTIYELKNKTLGIIGLGKIGLAVAKIASGFGMRVIASHRKSDPPVIENIENVSQDSLFRESDIISLHAPLNDSTYHLINKKTLSKMKENAVLINTARGDLINESDLFTALNENRIGAALLDVLSEEPPPIDHILLTCPNCYITPHQAWSSYEARVKLLKGIENNIDQFLIGKPINVVN